MSDVTDEASDEDEEVPVSTLGSAINYPLDEYHLPKKLLIHTGSMVKTTSASVSIFINSIKYFCFFITIAKGQYLNAYSNKKIFLIQKFVRSFIVIILSIYFLRANSVAQSFHLLFWQYH